METKVVFVGSGYIARMHCKALAQIPGVQIAAFCNPEPELAQPLAELYQAKIYANCAEMLDAEKPHAVYICVPPFAHGDAEQQVAQRGIPMLVEKPIALDLNQAQKNLQIIKKNHVITAVGYEFRYLNIVQKLKQAIANKKISLCLGRYACTMPNVYWWKDKKLGGGQILEQSTHIYDLFRYLLGEVSAVQAWGNYGIMAPRENYSVEDASVVNLKFAQGTIGNISSNCLYPKGGKIEFELIGDAFRGEISLSDKTLKLMDGENIETMEGENTQEIFLKEDQIFIDAVRSGNPQAILCDYEEAVKTLALTLQSINTIDANREL